MKDWCLNMIRNKSISFHLWNIPFSVQHLEDLWVLCSPVTPIVEVLRGSPGRSLISFYGSVSRKPLGSFKFLIPSARLAAPVVLAFRSARFARSARSRQKASFQSNWLVMTSRLLTSVLREQFRSLDIQIFSFWAWGVWNIFQYEFEQEDTASISMNMLMKSEDLISELNNVCG